MKILVNVTLAIFYLTLVITLAVLAGMGVVHAFELFIQGL